MSKDEPQNRYEGSFLGYENVLQMDYGYGCIILLIY